MNKTLMGLALAGAMASPNMLAAFDGALTMSTSGTQGGMYRVTSSPLGAFDTFCLENGETFSSGSYSYNLNTGAVASTGNPLTDAVDSRTGLPMDTISIGTAWLYSNFRNNTLVGIAGAANVSAQKIQDAIHYLEGERLDKGTGAALVTAAENNIPAQFNKNATLNSDGFYGVVALNLYNGPGGVASHFNLPGNTGPLTLNQSHLAVVPEPSTLVAGALMALPFGASVIRVIRRKS